MDEFGSFGALLGGHPNKKVNGVEANTGSLGHGLGFATGIAIALKKNEKDKNEYLCLVSSFCCVYDRML